MHTVFDSREYFLLQKPSQRCGSQDLVCVEGFRLRRLFLFPAPALTAFISPEESDQRCCRANASRSFHLVKGASNEKITGLFPLPPERIRALSRTNNLPQLCAYIMHTAKVSKNSLSARRRSVPAKILSCVFLERPQRCVILVGTSVRVGARRHREALQ